MKKTVLILGSALMLFSNVTLQAAEKMKFGLKGGAALFMPPVKEVDIDLIVREVHKSKMTTSPSVGIFGDYMILDNLSVGVELGYSRKGLILSTHYVAADKANLKKNLVCPGCGVGIRNEYEGNYIHTLDVSMPFAFYPAGKELSVFLAPKAYFALVERSYDSRNKKSTREKDRMYNLFNIGLAGGVKYEIAETGVFLGGNYELFFLDTLNSKTKELVNEANKNKKTYTQGAQFFVGFNLASLL